LRWLFSAPAPLTSPKWPPAQLEERQRLAVPGSRRPRPAVWERHELPPTAPLDLDGDGDGQDDLRSACLVDALSAQAASSSGTAECSASSSMPVCRRRTSMSLGETITFSTRSRTMRCCSAGSAASQGLAGPGFAAHSRPSGACAGRTILGSDQNSVKTARRARVDPGNQDSAATPRGVPRARATGVPISATACSRRCRPF
jgi:hypothetical protein